MTRALDLAKRRNKFGATRTTVDGAVFDSKAEARRWSELCLLQKAGKIANLERQRKFKIVVNGVLITTYRCDFAYDDRALGLLVVEDVKSPPTAKKRDFRLVQRLMRACHGIDVKVIS